jgi:hypothetical protein
MADQPIKLPRHSKGKRPYFFDDPAIDQMMTFIVELTAEVSVVYDRLDTMERLLDAKGTISRADIEAYRPPDNIEQERMARRDGYLKRVFRMHPPQATYGKRRDDFDEEEAAFAAAPKKASAKKVKKPAAKKPKAKAKRRK